MVKFTHININNNELIQKLLSLTLGITNYIKDTACTMATEDHQKINLLLGQTCAYTSHALSLTTLTINQKKYYYRLAILKFQKATSLLLVHTIPTVLIQQAKEIKIIFNKISNKYNLFKGGSNHE